MTLRIALRRSAAVHDNFEDLQKKARTDLGEFKQRADQQLELLGAKWREQTLPGSTRPTPTDLLQALLDLTQRGGKRVRPALAYFSASCFDHGLDESALLEAVLSVEVLQTYLLIHDDVMDDDPERRGGPAVHVALTRLSGDETTGRSLAILAGDLGCALAGKLLLHPSIPPQRALKASEELFTMQWEVIQGQLLDIVGGADPLLVHDAKTASYTTRGPVRLGAVLAGAAEEQVELLGRYGTPLGKAFQVRDDLLGTFGKAADLGKPVGSDLRAGKRTVLVRQALEQANESQCEAIEAVLGEGDAPDELIEKACRAIEETGAKKRSEDLIDRLTGEALAVLDEPVAAGLRDPGVSFLRGVALLLAERDR